MSGKKYKFDPHSLKYQEIDSNKQTIVKSIISIFVSTIVVAIVLYVAMAYIIETPKQKSLKKENKKLEEQYEYLISKYDQTDNVLEELKKRDANIYRAIFEAEPPNTIKNSIDFSLLDSLDDASLSELNTELIDRTLAGVKKEQDAYKELINLFQSKKEDFNNIPAIQPIENSNLKKVIYGFGNRIDPVYKTPSFHPGIDFAAPKGTPIFATADGKVTRADNKIRGLGNHIRINHGNDFETLYAHLSEMDVRVGSKVKRGDVIGYVGNTGKSLVSHLHYEVIYKEEPVNPVHFFFIELDSRQYSKIIRSASRSGISLD